MAGVTPLHLKDLNTRTVRSALHSVGSATCRELASATGLSQVTVGAIVQMLVERGEAFEDDWAPSNGGRPARRYRYAERRQLVLVGLTREVDGRDTLCLRVCDLFGQVIEARDIRLDPRGLDAFETPIAALLEQYPAVAAIGLALPGIAVDGTIVALDYPALIGVPLASRFQERFGRPVVLENDVNAAVMGTTGDGSQAYVYFPRKYGPGAGLRLDGRLVRGRRNFAGEVGFLPLGVAWGEALTSSLDASSDVIARVVMSIAAVFAPESVVLFGEFITPEHLNRVRRRCAEGLPEGMAPTIVQTNDFTLNVQTGLIGLTLDLLPR